MPDLRTHVCFESGEEEGRDNTVIFLNLDCHFKQCQSPPLNKTVFFMFWQLPLWQVSNQKNIWCALGDS